MNKVERFDGEYAFLSNFYPCTIIYEGLTYPSVEHAYQAAKTKDERQRREIAALKSPADAKRYGRRVTLRNDWTTQKRLVIMYQLVRQKFLDGKLRTMLLQTKDKELIEGNYWNDEFWGVCRGRGENNLGRILMRVRGTEETLGQMRKMGCFVEVSGYIADPPFVNDALLFSSEQLGDITESLHDSINEVLRREMYGEN